MSAGDPFTVQALDFSLLFSVAHPGVEKSFLDGLKSGRTLSNAAIGILRLAPALVSVRTVQFQANLSSICSSGAPTPCCSGDLPWNFHTLNSLAVISVSGSVGE